jgi:cytidylate kinase
MDEFAEVIAIDGPAGAGKTTLGHWLADELDFAHLETGFLYRAAAYRASAHGIRKEGWGGDLLAGLEVCPRTPRLGGRPQRLSFGGHELDIEHDLFSSEVDELVACVSSVAAVRDGVRELARTIAGRGQLIISGRDVGTAIVPEAHHKLFLTADQDIRAARLGRSVNMPGSRAATPRQNPQSAEDSRHKLESKLLAQHIQPAADALVLDTTALTIDAVRSATLRHLGRSQ